MGGTREKQTVGSVRRKQAMGKGLVHSELDEVNQEGPIYDYYIGYIYPKTTCLWIG